MRACQPTSDRFLEQAQEIRPTLMLMPRSGRGDSPVVAGQPTVRSRVSSRIKTELALRLTIERTRRATMIERYTVSRFSWATLVRLNRYLEFFGKLTTGLYVAFVATLVFGVNWKDLVESTFNSGAPVKGAIVLALVLPTLLFVALRSMVGYGRWRLQRELWRRDVAALEKPAATAAAEA